MRAPRLIYDVISFSSGNHGLVCERTLGDRPPFSFRRWAAKLRRDVGTDWRLLAAKVTCCGAASNVKRNESCAFLDKDKIIDADLE